MPADDSVELASFVSHSITQIVKGISEAQSEIAETGAYINPHVVNGYASTGQLISRPSDKGERIISTINFDIAVTIQSGQGNKTGIAVMLGVLSAGAGGSKELRDSRVSRMQFAVPILLPMGGEVSPQPTRKTLPQMSRNAKQQ